MSSLFLKRSFYEVVAEHVREVIQAKYFDLDLSSLVETIKFGYAARGGSTTGVEHVAAE